MLLKGYVTCAYPESFVRRGPILMFFLLFLLMRIEDPNITIRGPSSARQRFVGGPMMAEHSMPAW